MTRLPPSCRVAVALWVALLAGVTLRVALSSPHSQTVVPIYLAAGERWRDADDLYALDTGLDVYRNPPGFAAAFAPLTPLPTKLVGVLWRLAGAAVFLRGLWRFRREVVPELSAHQVGLMFAVAAVLALPSVNNGQVNTLIAGAALNGVAAAGGGRWWAAAAWFTLGGWVKLYPFAVALLACVAAPAKLLPRLVVLGAAAFAVPFVLRDPAYIIEQHRNFVHFLGLDDRTYSALERVPRDWTIVPRVWLGLVPFPVTTKAVSALAGIAAAVMVWLARRDRPWPVVLVLGCVWMTAFGPATESNTYALLAGAAGYVAAAACSRRATWWAWVGVVMLAVPIVRAALPRNWPTTALTPQPVGALVVAASLLVNNRVGRSTLTPDPRATPCGPHDAAASR